MALPKKKTTKAKRDSRRSHWKAKPSTYSECPRCRQPKVPHRVCANCGHYGGRQAVEVQ